MILMCIISSNKVGNVDGKDLIYCKNEMNVFILSLLLLSSEMVIDVSDENTLNIFRRH